MNWRLKYLLWKMYKNWNNIVTTYVCKTCIRMLYEKAMFSVASFDIQPVIDYVSEFCDRSTTSCKISHANNNWFYKLKWSYLKSYCIQRISSESLLKIMGQILSCRHKKWLLSVTKLSQHLLASFDLKYAKLEYKLDSSGHEMKATDNKKDN